MGVIYSITNILNKKQYIGSTINFDKRKKLHLKNLLNNTHHNYHLQSSYNIHGVESFVFEILEQVDDNNNLINREQWWIDNSNSEYNICKIANSSLGIKRRDETKEKVRQYNLGLKHPQFRNDIKSVAQGKENHWTKKKKFSEESKEKMSLSHKKLYELGYINPLKGKKVDRDIVNRIAEKTSKPVIQYDKYNNIIREYKSVTETKLYGFNPGHVSLCCKNKRKTHGNYIWKYKNEQNRIN